MLLDALDMVVDYYCSIVAVEFLLFLFCGDMVAARLSFLGVVASCTFCGFGG